MLSLPDGGKTVTQHFVLWEVPTDFGISSRGTESCLRRSSRSACSDPSTFCCRHSLRPFQIKAGISPELFSLLFRFRKREFSGSVTIKEFFAGSFEPIPTRCVLQ